MSWFVYVVECADGSLYAGITTDLERRLAEHDSGAGARYTRGRGPVRLRWHQECPDRAAASRREYEIKHLSRRDKLALLEDLEATARTQLDQ